MNNNSDSKIQEKIKSSAGKRIQKIDMQNFIYKKVIIPPCLQYASPNKSFSKLSARQFDHYS
jgi:hypothetical protein